MLHSDSLISPLTSPLAVNQLNYRSAFSRLSALTTIFERFSLLVDLAHKLPNIISDQYVVRANWQSDVHDLIRFNFRNLKIIACQIPLADDFAKTPRQMLICKK